MTGPTGVGVLHPQLLEALLEMGVSPEMFLAAQQQPIAVADTIEQQTDPMFPVEQLLDVQPSPAPEISVNPPPEAGGGSVLPGGLLQRILGGLGGMDANVREGLIGAGLGILGAQGTYGDFGAAVGQGGLVGLNLYGLAKRRTGIDSAKRAQIEAQKEAAREQRALKRLSVLQSLADRNPEAANQMLAKDKELQQYIPLLPGGTFRGDPGKPTIQVNERTGQVFAINAATGTVAPIGNIGAQPPVGGGDTGQFTQEILNPETGIPEVWRFDRRGNPIQKLGIAPPRGGMSVEVDPKTGQVRFSTGGAAKVPSSVVSKAYETYDAARQAANVAEALLPAIEDTSVGILGDLQSMKYGAAAQMKGALGSFLRNAEADLRPVLASAGIDPDKTFDPNRATVEVLGDTLAIMHRRASGDTRLSNFDFDTARAALGLNQKLISADDVRHRVKLVRDIARMQERMMQDRIQELTGQPPAGGPIPGGRPAAASGAERKSARDRFEELMAQGVSEEEAYQLLAEEGY